MRMSGMVMVMMGSHEMLYYNVLGFGKAVRPFTKSLIFLRFTGDRRIAKRRPESHAPLWQPAPHSGERSKRLP